jgi:hypothetical protein
VGRCHDLVVPNVLLTKQDFVIERGISLRVAWAIPQGTGRVQKAWLLGVVADDGKQRKVVRATFPLPREATGSGLRLVESTS